MFDDDKEEYYSKQYDDKKGNVFKKKSIASIFVAIQVLIDVLKGM
jgi:hypothetical protein